MRKYVVLLLVFAAAIFGIAAAETMKEFGGGNVAGVEVFVDGTCLACDG